MIAKKICLLGSFAVGKTSLVRRFVNSLFDERYLTTIGVRTDKKVVQVDGLDVKLMIWDLQGEDELQSVHRWQVRDSAGYLLVADGTRRDTLRAAVALRERLLAELGELPFLLLLNKRDLAGEWEVGEPELQPLGEAGWTIHETSAKTGEGVERAFEELARRVSAVVPPAPRA